MASKIYPGKTDNSEWTGGNKNNSRGILGTCRDRQ